MQETSQHKSRERHERSMDLIPGGVPGIRAPENFAEAGYLVFPPGGDRARPRDPDDNRCLDRLLDCGPVIFPGGLSMAAALATPETLAWERGLDAIGTLLAAELATRDARPGN